MRRENLLEIRQSITGATEDAALGHIVSPRLKLLDDGRDRLYGQGIGSNYQAQGLKLSKHFKV